MAKKQGRAANIRYGICTNTSGKEDGTTCSKCQNKEIQAIRASKDFICEECGEPLKKVDKTPPPTWPIKAIIIALAVIGCGVGAWFILRGSSEQESISITLNTDTLSLNVGDSISLKATISTQPENADVSVSFMSDNVKVAQVSSYGTVMAISKGEANITVVAQMESGIADTVQTRVTINGASVKVASSDTSIETTYKKTPYTRSTNNNISGNNRGSCNLGWGKYHGDMQDGKPHGVGEVNVISTHVIDLKSDDGATITVYPGETITARFLNGRLRSGDICRKDGSSDMFSIF